MAHDATEPQDRPTAGATAGATAAGTPFQRSLGLRWSFDDGAPAAVEIAVEIHDGVRGPVGSLEGGVVATLVDVAGASAAARATGRMVATQQMSLSFLAPGRVGPVVARARPVRVGRDDVVSEVHVTDRGRDGRLVAVALVTLRLFDPLPAPD
jgi:acyl-CoA thioesterase